MAQSLKITRNLIADFRLRLTNEGITNHYRESSFRDEPSPPEISVGVQDNSEDFRAGPGIGSGFYRAVMLLDCQSYINDDPDLIQLEDLEEKVRNAFLVDDILAQLNTLSVFNEYKGLHVDSATPEEEERFNHLAVPMTVWFRPSNEKP